MINILMLVMMFVLFGTIITQAIYFKINWVDSRGEISISKKIFVLGKLSLISSWIICLIHLILADIKLIETGLRIIEIPNFLEGISVIILFIGLLFMVPSFYYLGEDNKAGLPRKETTLKTKGIYLISRNPMYIGFFLASISSSIFTFNPITWIFTIIAIYIHHKIVKSEEIFLSKRFGMDYEDYCKRVRRYI